MNKGRISRYEILIGNNVICMKFVEEIHNNFQE